MDCWNTLCMQATWNVCHRSHGTSTLSPDYRLGESRLVSSTWYRLASISVQGHNQCFSRLTATSICGVAGLSDTFQSIFHCSLSVSHSSLMFQAFMFFLTLSFLQLLLPYQHGFPLWYFPSVFNSATALMFSALSILITYSRTIPTFSFSWPPLSIQPLLPPISPHFNNVPVGTHSTHCQSHHPLLRCCHLLYISSWHPPCFAAIKQGHPNYCLGYQDKTWWSLFRSSCKQDHYQVVHERYQQLHFHWNSLGTDHSGQISRNGVSISTMASHLCILTGSVGVLFLLCWLQANSFPNTLYLHLSSLCSIIITLSRLHNTRSSANSIAQGISLEIPYMLTSIMTMSTHNSGPSGDPWWIFCNFTILQLYYVYEQTRWGSHWRLLMSQFHWWIYLKCFFTSKNFGLDKTR